MCFSPEVSIWIAAFEFILAGFILLKYKKSFLPKFLALFIVLLGLYQFSEFMLCTSDNPKAWATVGFLSYTILPALTLHFIMRITGSGKKVALLYFPAAIFLVAPLFYDSFILSHECREVFVRVHNALFDGHQTGFFVYSLYYFGYISMGWWLLWRAYVKERSIALKKMQLIAFGSLTIMNVPALVLLIIMPAYNAVFPSMYCDFAVLFALGAFAMAAIEDKYAVLSRKKTSHRQESSTKK